MIKPDMDGQPVEIFSFTHSCEAFRTVFPFIFTSVAKSTQKLYFVDEFASDLVKHTDNVLTPVKLMFKHDSTVSCHVKKTVSLRFQKMCKEKNLNTIFFFVKI